VPHSELDGVGRFKVRAGAGGGGCGLHGDASNCFTALHGAGVGWGKGSVAATRQTPNDSTCLRLTHLSFSCMVIVCHLQLCVISSG
jgi:hypothetical protein